MKNDRKYFRGDLTPEFLKAAKKKPPSAAASLKKILFATEQVRRNILHPASKDLGSIAIERKDTGPFIGTDAKTLTIKTDRECEAEMERLLASLFPDALLISEEKFGASTPEEKRTSLEEALKTDKPVILTDPLDATRDFRGGGDGYAVMVTMLHKGEIIAAAIHRCADHSRPDGTGHTLTFETGDGVRRDGFLLTPLSERKFPDDPALLRGYAGIEFMEPMRKKENGVMPNLSGRFDSLSDLWTCSKIYDDLITGRHHFLLVAPPADIFDYPAGIALVRKSGGVVKFLDGTDATFSEIVKRQGFSGDVAAVKSLHNTLIFAVSENVFESVRKTVCDAAGITPPPQAPHQKGTTPIAPR